MDTFRDKLEILMIDAAKRFAEFTFTDADLDAEVEKYKAYAERLGPFITDTVQFVNEAHKNGKRILVEGGQATLLDIDFGTYPYVTSSNPSVGGIFTGLGIAPNKLGDIIGVVCITLLILLHYLFLYFRQFHPFFPPIFFQYIL